MSHIATVALEIKDLDALRAAVAAAGLEWREGQRHHRWYGRRMDDQRDLAGVTSALGECEHAIGIPGDQTAYEVGVVRKTDGTYTLASDSFDGRLFRLTGENCCRLVQAYVREVATRTLARSGYTAQGARMLPDGTVEMVFAGR